ncbi:TIGR02186 family protein [Tropicibacter sp. R15_0]|uniref:TIGR02186 family protein n=1 Tax=Tropicibacter sp. R15_0 TaxID=2821101 RepID=UPI001ADBD639|nr:TIGR02186 family protein [Tropicibacter sp. R15_0]MBO9465735.1 TIGR02186 family protein [Tropicibacter sp. R15_0]
MMRLLLTFLLLFALPLKAEEVVLGLSQDTISIDANFSGSEILIYGAIKRETEIPEELLQVIITVAGPSQPVTVRKKDRRFGIWVNTEAVEVDSAPSFYAVATSHEWPLVISDTEDLRHKISVERAIRAVGVAADDPQRFTQALTRIRTSEDKYQQRDFEVNLRQQTLFDTAIKLPANLTEGAYKTRVFLTRNKEVISVYETEIEVRKVGLERWLFTLSRQQPLLYGLMSLAIAIAAGWGASAAFQILRRG